MAVDAEDAGPSLPPNAQPSAMAAAEIGDAVDRQLGAKQRDNLLGRTDCKRRQVAVEIVVVLVQLALPFR